MNDRSESSPINRPFRSTFLYHLGPDQRAALERFGDLLESVLLEYGGSHGQEAVNLMRARAVQEDLEVLEAYLEETCDNWRGARGEIGLDLRKVIMDTFRAVSDTALAVAAAIEEETGRTPRTTDPR